MKSKHGIVFSSAIVVLCTLTITLYKLKIFSLKALLSAIIGLSVISLITMIGETVSKKGKTIPIPKDDGSEGNDNIDYQI
jgi:hypothetical protein